MHCLSSFTSLNNTDVHSITRHRMHLYWHSKNIMLRTYNSHLGPISLSLALILYIDETWLHIIFDASKNHIHLQRIKLVPAEFIPKALRSSSSTLCVSFITPSTISTCFIDVLIWGGLYSPPKCKLPESFKCLVQLSDL